MELEAHEDNCDFKPMKCENKGCGASVLNKEFKEHQEKCPFFILQCEYCKNNEIRMKLEEHKKNCDFRPIKCPDCKKNFLFKDYLRHREVCEEIIVTCEKCDEQFPRKFNNSHDCIKDMARTIRELRSAISNSQDSMKDMARTIIELKSIIENLACKDCGENCFSCSFCQKSKCFICRYKKCENCMKVHCKNCVRKCDKCKKLCCLKCLNSCGKCNGAICIVCDSVKNIECSICHKLHCKQCTANHIKKCINCGKLCCSSCIPSKCFKCEAQICKECVEAKMVSSCYKCGKFACKACFNSYQCWKCKMRFCKACRKAHKLSADCKNYLPGLSWEQLCSGKEKITDIRVLPGMYGSAVQDSAGFIWLIGYGDLIYKFNPKTLANESFKLPFAAAESRSSHYDNKHFIYIWNSGYYSRLIRFNTLNGQIDGLQKAPSSFFNFSNGVFRNNKLYLLNDRLELMMFDPENNKWQDGIFNSGYVFMLPDPKNEDNIYFLKRRKCLELYSISQNKIIKSFAENSDIDVSQQYNIIINDSEDPENSFILLLGEEPPKALSIKENIWHKLNYKNNRDGYLHFDGEKLWDCVRVGKDDSKFDVVWRQIIFE